jgi:plasmid stabilization system protein ParE
MAASIEFSPDARTEFDDAFDWYAERSTKAATGFADEVNRVINLIAADPQRHARTYTDCQLCRLIRYPWCIIYRDENETVLIVAIAHTKRRPGYWHDRL